MKKAPLLASGPAHYAQLEHARQHPDPARRRQQPLRRKDFIHEKPAATPRLRADKEAGAIWYGDQLLASGIPPDAWRYQLGNKSALEWVIDQHQERPPKDPTIRAHFDTYRLADHLAEVVDLLARVTTVSVETMRIVDELAAVSPLAPANAVAKPLHIVPAPATPQAARQLLLDFSRPAEPVAPPTTFTLALTRSQSDFYLEWLGTEREGNALECLLDAHGHAWDSRVEVYDTTQYWQGPKGMPGSWMAALVVAPEQKGHPHTGNNSN